MADHGPGSEAHAALVCPVGRYANILDPWDFRTRCCNFMSLPTPSLESRTCSPIDDMDWYGWYGRPCWGCRIYRAAGQWLHQGQAFWNKTLIRSKSAQLQAIENTETWRIVALPDVSQVARQFGRISGGVRSGSQIDSWNQNRLKIKPNRRITPQQQSNAAIWAANISRYLSDTCGNSSRERERLVG